jgi:hypothetical protein
VTTIGTTATHRIARGRDLVLVAPVSIGVACLAACAVTLAMLGGVLPVSQTVVVTLAAAAAGWMAAWSP